MRSSYLLYNKIIAAPLAAIIIYCGIYPLLGNWTVQCQVEKATRHACIGCGLTRGIHQALLFHFDKALEWNPSSLLILSFFLIALIMRFGINILLSKTEDIKRVRTLLYSDVIFSVLMFLFCFRHFFTADILR